MKFFVCIIFSLSSFYLQAQYSRQAVILTDSSEKTSELKIPFAGIRVIDARFDQTKIGCVYNSVFMNSVSFEKSAAVFPDSMKNYLKVFLGKFIQTTPESKDSLVILVKTFRIADYLLATVDNYGMELNLTLNFSASFFLNRQGRNYRLFSIDEALMKYVERIKEKKKVKHNEGTRADALVFMLNKLLKDRIWQPINPEISFTNEEIESAVVARFNLPILKQPYRKGLYRSFRDFTNNAPVDSSSGFAYKGDKINKVLNQHMETVDLSGFWGLSDGKNVYIIYNTEISKLIPIDNGFAFPFYRKRVELSGGSVVNLLTYKAGDGANIKLFHDLNMENGTVFTEEIYGSKTKK